MYSQSGFPKRPRKSDHRKELGFFCFAVRDLYWGRAYCFRNFMVRLNKTQTFPNENIFFAFGLIWPFVSHNTTFSRVKVELSCRPSLFNYGLELYKGTFQARQKYYIWMCKKNWPLAGFTWLLPNTRFITLPGLLKSKFVTPVRCVVVSFLLFVLFLTMLTFVFYSIILFFIL